MPPSRVLILSTSVGSGHIAAAGALEQAFRRHPQLEVVNQEALVLTSEAYRMIAADAYRLLARENSWILGLLYDYNDQPFKNQALFRNLFDLINAQPLVEFIQDFDPDLAVCTHFMPAGIISQLLAQRQIRCGLAIVATDYDIQGMWLHPLFNRYFVALEETRARLASLGLPAERITASGIPVGAALSEPIDREAILARYDLRPDRPILLLSAGAVGGGPTHELVDQIRRLRHPVQTIVICGHNAKLRRDIEALVYPDAADFRVLGYCAEMPSLLRVATLFIGKPGGLTSAECMAAGLPMLIIAPIPGQEERNSNHLLESGAALRCNDLETVAFKIDALLDDPARIAQLRAGTARLARPAAARTIAETLLAADEEPYTVDPREISRLARREAAPAHPRVGAAKLAAIYAEATGVLVGTLSGAQCRAISGRRLSANPLTITLSRPIVAQLSLLGVDPATLARLDQLLAADSPASVRLIAL